VIRKSPFVLSVLEPPPPEPLGLIVATSKANASREVSWGWTGARCGMAEPDSPTVKAARMHACLTRFMFPRIQGHFNFSESSKPHYFRRIGMV
jgi:hypothetical protein